MKKIFLTLLILLASSSALAQAATNNSKLSWNQPLDTLVTTAAQAQALIYKQYPDGVTTGIVITGVTILSHNNELVKLCVSYKLLSVSK